MGKNVAMCGQMAAGKTTVADFLVEEHGYTKVSLAGASANDGVMHRLTMADAYRGTMYRILSNALEMK